MERLSVDTNTPFKIFIMVIVVLLVGVFGINAAMASKRSDMAWQEISKGAMLIDVRTAQEFKAGHLKNAINMPLSTLSKSANPIDRNTPIVVYCRSGSRASHAKRELYDMGFVNVYNGGGLEEMQASEP
ncbi:rhodanese-like domain-containing protein [Marinomonas fungiae]|uniref:Rhodanese-related sulfurtransferase n=1 Tax=Marinomonas fungiae TaxID=1137284 RepID=A0A0K6IPW2_9GAMM|nr:rhodanese-like domain-containing protein [Marinomonas fungiae]CUB05362.1 Rhodanese-related sulfurtransferase [Marinomonas fungiae]